MLRLRGMEANSPTQLAEEFACRKMTVDISAAIARADERQHERLGRCDLVAERDRDDLTASVEPCTVSSGRPARRRGNYF